MEILFEMNGRLYAKSSDQNIVTSGSDDIPKQNDEPEKKKSISEKEVVNEEFFSIAYSFVDSTM